MPSEIFELIRQAIIERKQIHAVCGGCLREMCPHALGWKNGREQALLYEFAGSEPDGSLKNWRCVQIDLMSKVVIVDGEWHTAANHSRRQTCVDTLELEVPY
jgi:DMSO/TMAO reductase YedYZ molybdopterin-dependent catalytic subunit